MKVPRLCDVISVRGRFHSSVNVLRDWRLGMDRTAYIVTPTIRALAERIVKEMEDQRGVRNWSITGPYGSGKSAFALFLADLLGFGLSHACRGTGDPGGIVRFRPMDFSPCW